jgi:hypothetical protein
METYTLNTAVEYSNQGRIEEWIHDYLRGEGDNISFSDGLMLEKRYYIGPVKMPLNLFQRCCGPEAGLKYRIDKSGFEKRVNTMCVKLNSGWDMPPLIINYVDGKFELNDGNHRYEALIRSAKTEYYIIIWITKLNDYQNFVENYSSYINLE